MIGTLYKREIKKSPKVMSFSSGTLETITKYVAKTASNKTKEEYCTAFIFFNAIFFLFFCTKLLSKKQGIVKEIQNIATVIIIIIIF